MPSAAVAGHYEFFNGALQKKTEQNSANTLVWTFLKKCKLL